jgi:hypothetical protein
VFPCRLFGQARDHHSSCAGAYCVIRGRGAVGGARLREQPPEPSIVDEIPQDPDNALLLIWKRGREVEEGEEGERGGGEGKEGKGQP